MRKTTLAVLLAVAGTFVGLERTPRFLAWGQEKVAQGSKSGPSTRTGESRLPSGDSRATEPNLKVAFIGDSGYGPSEQAVLNLIKSEGAQAVLHQGDFDYHGDPVGFWSSVDKVLGANFPYFISVGNHDIANWPATVKPSYSQYLVGRMARIGVKPDRTNLNSQMYSLVFKGLKVVFVGESRGVGDQVYAPYIKARLAADNHIWKVCSWHRNMAAMQMGDKTDDMGWGVYEECKDNGAIIATAHEHSYERTKTLTSIRNQIVDSLSPDPNRLTVAPGRTFVFVSGLGGESIRPQRRCLPAVAPYGCNGEWAKIYTSNQNAQYGALFITFNVDGDRNKAQGYFKNISGTIVDEFEIINGTGSSH